MTQAETSGMFLRALLLSLFNAGRLTAGAVFQAGEHIDFLARAAGQLEQAQRLAGQVADIVAAPTAITSPRARIQVDRSDKSPRAKRWRQLNYEEGILPPPRVPAGKADRDAKRQAELISMPLEQLGIERKQARP